MEWKKVRDEGVCVWGGAVCPWDMGKIYPNCKSARDVFICSCYAMSCTL